MINFKIASEIISNSQWFYDIPTGYSYFESLDNDYDIDDVLYWLDNKTFGILLLQDIYEENNIEFNDYLDTLEGSGDELNDEKYIAKLFLNYFANIIAKGKISTQRKKINLPEWVEFTLNI